MADQKIYKFKKDTMERCKAVPVALHRDFIPIYPAIVKVLDLEKLQFGIWIRGSEEILEYLSPQLSLEERKKAVPALLEVIARTQSFTKLYIRKADKRKLYDNLFNTKKDALLTSPLLKKNRALGVAYLKLSMCAANLASGINTAVIEYAEEKAANAVAEIGDSPIAIDLLFDLINKDEKFYDHIALVSLLAVSLAKYLKIEDSEMRKIVLGSMFHDIGISYLDIPNIYTAPLSPNEQKLYEKHPIIGVEKFSEAEARGLKVPEEVFIIILQHHEHMNGTGFPNHLQGRK